MSTRCPYCGVELQETNWGRKFCPNDGIILEIDEQEESETVDNKKESYFG